MDKDYISTALEAAFFILESKGTQKEKIPILLWLSERKQLQLYGDILTNEGNEDYFLIDYPTRISIINHKSTVPYQEEDIMDYISEAEVEILDAVYEKYNKFTYFELIDKTKDFPEVQNSKNNFINPFYFFKKPNNDDFFEDIPVGNKASSEYDKFIISLHLTSCNWKSPF